MNRSNSSKLSLQPFSPTALLTVSSLLILFCLVRGQTTLLKLGIPWRFTSTDRWIIVAGLSSSFLGVIVAKLRSENFRDNHVIDKSILAKRADSIILIGFIGYFVYYGLAIFNLSGLRLEKLITIPGLTTLTQVLPVGIAAKYYLKKTTQLNLKFRLQFTIAILLVTSRLFLNRERLALYELLIPLALIYVGYSSLGKRVRLILILPAASFGSVVLFGFAEYFRSWQFFSNRWSGGYLNFVLVRMEAYFTTALNNGSIYYEQIKYTTQLPLIAGDFAIKFPFFRNLLGDTATLNSEWKSQLYAGARSLEFTNVNPFLGLASDLTIPGMCLSFFLILFGLQYMYERTKTDSGLSVIIFSILMIGMFDFTRIEWWTMGRTFPMIISLLYLRGSLIRKENYENRLYLTHERIKSKH